MSRLLFALIAVFWVTMNGLLWRDEFGGGRLQESPVPPSVVWQKVLTAPDNSALDIYYQGRKAGFMRWLPNVGKEAATGKVNTEEFAPEGQIRHLSGYTIDVDGNGRLGESMDRLFFSLNLKFATNSDWQTLVARVSVLSNAWEVRASAIDRKLKVIFEESGRKSENIFTFEDLQNPQTLLRAYGGPFAAVLLGGMLPSSNLADSRARGMFEVPIEAASGYLLAGHTRIKVYHLHARLLDRYNVDVYISPVGEILRADFPENFQLISDALPGQEILKGGKK